MFQAGSLINDSLLWLKSSISSYTGFETRRRNNNHNGRRFFFKPNEPNEELQQQFGPTIRSKLKKITDSINSCQDSVLFIKCQSDSLKRLLNMEIMGAEQAKNIQLEYVNIKNMSAVEIEIFQNSAKNAKQYLAELRVFTSGMIENLVLVYCLLANVGSITVAGLSTYVIWKLNFPFRSLVGLLLISGGITACILTNQAGQILLKHPIYADQLLVDTKFSESSRLLLLETINQAGKLDRLMEEMDHQVHLFNWARMRLERRLAFGVGKLFIEQAPTDNYDEPMTT